MSQTRAIIDRQILITHRVQPNAMSAALPSPFRPRLYNGHAIAALSLVRLKPPKARLMPSLITTQPEHIAHQLAVEWTQDGQTRAGWFMLRRDTTARSALIGGSIFPGKLHHARFHVHEQELRFRINCDSDDKQSHVRVDAFGADFLPKGAIFETVEEATTFLQPATSFYTTATSSGELEGLNVTLLKWPIRAMALWESTSSVFDSAFPKDTVEVDCAMLVRNADYEWSISCHPEPDSCVTRAGTPRSE